MTEKMRQALEAAYDEIKVFTDEAFASTVFTPEGLKHLKVTIAVVEKALAEPTEADSIPQLKGEITVLQQQLVEEKETKRMYIEGLDAAEKRGYDKALKEYAASSAQVQRWLAEAREEGQENKDGETIGNLLSLPQQIKEQSKRLAESSVEIEKLRAKVVTMKLNAMELVTSMKDGDKQKYSNDKARTAAQERLLVEDTEYCANCDELGRLEYQQKLGEIELAMLQDTFRANLAIAEMR